MNTREKFLEVCISRRLVMDNRTRIINTALCRETDRPPFICVFGPWQETLDRWYTEGLEKEIDWYKEMSFDSGFDIVGVNYGYNPCFEEQILEDKGDTLIIRDSLGILQEKRKSGSSIPRFIDNPVKNREDWEKLKKERLNPHDAERFPGNWEEMARQYNEGDYVMQLGRFPYGLFGTLRDMMGVEGLLVSFYDQPDLIHNMMDYLTDFWIAIYEKVCRDVKVDCIHMWEDMSGKTGSLISPAMVREFMLPNYKKLRAFADAHDIPIFSLDTDGDCSELVPIYMEGGINLVFPFEVAAGCDVKEYRKKYPGLCIMGGIDKRELAKGKEAIDKELEKVREMFEYKGYIADLDHLIHPEVSWSNYKYYIRQLKEIIGV